MSSSNPRVDSPRSRRTLKQTRSRGGNETSIGTRSNGDGPSERQFDGPTHSKECPSVVTVAARPADIICGRGLHVMNRQGNLNLHLLASRHRQTYFRSTRRDKATITRNIVQEIKSTGARFLRGLDKDSAADDRWVEVDDKTAYKKVSHALRLRDHGKNFSKSIEIQEMTSNNTITTSRSALPTPIEPGVARPPQPYDSGNLGFGLASSLSLARMGVPALPPQQQVQYIPIHPSQQLDYYARLQAQVQPLQLVPPLYNANPFISALDPRTVANAFGATLAVLSQTIHPELRSHLDGSTGASQDSPASHDAEGRQSHG